MSIALHVGKCNVYSRTAFGKFLCLLYLGLQLYCKLLVCQSVDEYTYAVERIAVYAIAQHVGFVGSLIHLRHARRYAHALAPCLEGVVFGLYYVAHNASHYSHVHQFVFRYSLV